MLDRLTIIMLQVLLCLTCVGCSSVVDDEVEVVERVKVGDRVPAFTVEVVDNGEHKSFTTDELAGETVIVLFHTTCPDCQRELPRLNQYYLQHKDDAGFQMVAISRGEGEETVSAFWKEKGLLIPYSAQADRRVFELFASNIVPRVYFCNAQGIVTRLFVEELPADF